MTTATGSTNTNTNGNTTDNGSTAGKGVRSAPTAVDAISKISKILDQLTPTDRKRVLAFVNETNE